jgi:hypothetical protein
VLGVVLPLCEMGVVACELDLLASALDGQSNSQAAVSRCPVLQWYDELWYID